MEAVLVDLLSLMVLVRGALYFGCALLTRLARRVVEQLRSLLWERRSPGAVVRASLPQHTTFRDDTPHVHWISERGPPVLRKAQEHP